VRSDGDWVVVLRRVIPLRRRMVIFRSRRRHNAVTMTMIRRMLVHSARR
jgi:hypothetical protein